MQPGRLLLFSLGFMGLVICGLLVARWWITPNHNITWDTCEAIVPGMTRDQVQSILRVPPGNYAVGDVRIMEGPGYFFTPADFRALDWGSRVETAIWIGPEAALVAHFDGEAKVKDASVRRVYATAYLTGEPRLTTLLRIFLPGWQRANKP